MSQDKGTAQGTEVEHARVSARLPTLNIEIAHGSSPESGSEWVRITLEAAPSFEAFGRFLELTNPVTYWAQALRMIWLPGLGAAQAIAWIPGHEEAKGIERHFTGASPRNAPACSPAQRQR